MRCLRYLHRICDRQAILPRSLEIPLCYDPTRYPLCHGGSADVWKGQYRGREVAAKVLRLWRQDDLEQIRRVGCWRLFRLVMWINNWPCFVKSFCGYVVTWKALCHPNVLPLLGVTMSETRFVMVSEWMVNGDINEFGNANINADRPRLVGFSFKILAFVCR